MKKALPVILAVLFGIVLLVTLLLCIVRTDLQDANLMSFINSSLGVADKLVGKKSEVPGLIKFGLSDTAFICFIVLSAALAAVIILLLKKLKAWFKEIAIPLITDGAVLLIASPVAALLYKAKVPKIAQGMLKNIYADTQKLILISGAITLLAGGAVLAAGLLTGKKSRKRK